MTDTTKSKPTSHLIIRSAVESFVNLGFNIDEIYEILLSRLNGSVKSKKKQVIQREYDALVFKNPVYTHIPSIAQIKSCVLNNDKLGHRMWKDMFCDNFNLPFKRIRGVYMIGESYIGASISLKTRLKNHHRLLSRGDHTNPILQEEYDDLMADGKKMPITYLHTDPNKEHHYKQKYNLFHPNGELFYSNPNVGSEKLLFAYKRFFRNYDSVDRLVNDIKNTWNVFDLGSYGGSMKDEDVISLIL